MSRGGPAQKVDAIVGGLGLGSASEGAAPVVPVCRACRSLKPCRLYSDEERASGVCRACSEGSAEIKASRRGVIPERYRWARLDAPLCPPSWPAGEVVIRDPDRARAAAWVASSGRILTIGGRSRAGKTVLLGAVANAWLEAGHEVTWIHASALRADQADKAAAERVLDQIRRASHLCLDGIGKELGNAGGGHGDGVAIQRLPLMQAAFEVINSRESGRFALVVELTREQIEGAYGIDTLTRIADARNATVIALPLLRKHDIQNLQ